MATQAHLRAKYEPRPVDPDEVIVREVVAAWEKAFGARTMPTEILAGEYDEKLARAFARYKELKAGSGV